MLTFMRSGSRSLIQILLGLMLVLIALSVNLLGDWLRDALNPRLRDQLKSNVADMRNTGERYGGASSAGRASGSPDRGTARFLRELARVAPRCALLPLAATTTLLPTAASEAPASGARRWRDWLAAEELAPRWPLLPDLARAAAWRSVQRFASSARPSLDSSFTASAWKRAVTSEMYADSAESRSTRSPHS